MVDLDWIFTYHPPSEEQVPRYERIRAAGKLFARVIVENTPECPSQTDAIKKIREAVMDANAAIALEGKV